MKAEPQKCPDESGDTTEGKAPKSLTQSVETEPEKSAVDLGAPESTKPNTDYQTFRCKLGQHW